MLSAAELRQAAAHSPLTEALGALVDWKEAVSADPSRIEEIQTFFESGALQLFLASALQRPAMVAAYRDKFAAFLAFLTGATFGKSLLDKLSTLAVLMDARPSRRELVELLSKRLSETAKVYRSSQNGGHEAIASLDCLITAQISKKDAITSPDFVRRLFEVRDAQRDLVQLTNQRLLALGESEAQVEREAADKSALEAIDEQIKSHLTRGQPLIEVVDVAKRQNAASKLEELKNGKRAELHALQTSTAQSIASLECRRAQLEHELTQCTQQLETMRECQILLEVRVADENMELERQLIAAGRQERQGDGQQGDGDGDGDGVGDGGGLMCALMDQGVHKSVAKALDELDLNLDEAQQQHARERGSGSGSNSKNSKSSNNSSGGGESQREAEASATAQELVSRICEYCQSELDCVQLMRKREALSSRKCDELERHIGECEQLGMAAAAAELEATRSKLRNMLTDDQQCIATAVEDLEAAISLAVGTDPEVEAAEWLVSVRQGLASNF
eukprot:g331.t1